MKSLWRRLRNLWRLSGLDIKKIEDVLVPEMGLQNSRPERVHMNITDTISFTMLPIAPKDPNYVSGWTFQGTDGKTYIFGKKMAIIVEDKKPEKEEPYEKNG